MRGPIQGRQIVSQFDNFRRKDCLRELKKIKLAWPGLNYTKAPGVLILLPSTPAIPPAPPSACEIARTPPD